MMDSTISEAESSVSDSLPPSTCGGCTSTSTRKAAILCSSCSTRWHTMCAGLKVRDAQALPVWHCRRCCSSDNTSRSQNVQNVQPTSPAASPPSPVLHSRLAELRDSCAVVRRIPKSARASVANCLSTIIDRAVMHPSIEAWTRLLFFAFVVLRSPEKSSQGTQTSIATAIKRQTEDISALSHCPPPPTAPPRPARSCQGGDEDSFARRVQGKCADGDVKAALRILTSNEDFIRPSPEVRDALQLKHPPSPADEVLSPCAQRRGYPCPHRHRSPGSVCHQDYAAGLRGRSGWNEATAPEAANLGGSYRAWKTAAQVHHAPS